MADKRVPQGNTEDPSGWSWGLPLVFIVLAWATAGGVLWAFIPDWQTRGQFGDMFGAVNALFSGGALVGVVYAIFLQHRELQLQRNELQLQRQELELTRHELERAASAQESAASGLLEQTRLQTSVLKAQLLRNRVDSYWRIYDPVSDAQVDGLRLYPEGYMSRSLFDKRYVNDDKAIRRYIYMSLVYEYLGFTHKLPDLGVPDPVGPDWVNRWTTELLACQEFRDVHEQYRGYMPEFEALVDGLIAKGGRNP